MGLAWINPLYFAGIMLLALPVLIHLVQKQHASGIKFPSLMFLQKIPLQQKRRFEIRHWVLLLLRCLLLLLLVFAFARPFLERADAGVEAGRVERDSVIVLDRSYSMRVADQWQQAQAAAVEFIEARRARDRVGLVLFDDELYRLLLAYTEYRLDDEEKRLVEQLGEAFPGIFAMIEHLTSRDLIADEPPREDVMEMLRHGALSDVDDDDGAIAEERLF